jgi:hypothetical protein
MKNKSVSTFPWWFYLLIKYQIASEDNYFIYEICKLSIVKMVLYRDAQDTDLARYPAGRILDIRKGYRLSGKAGNRISGRIFHSKYKCLLKYEINKETNFYESFLF